MIKLLLVHGAYHGAWCWERFLPELRRRGIEAVTLNLPLTDLGDDGPYVYLVGWN